MIPCHCRSRNAATDSRPSSSAPRSNSAPRLPPKTTMCQTTPATTTPMRPTTKVRCRRRGLLLQPEQQRQQRQQRPWPMGRLSSRGVNRLPRPRPRLRADPQASAARVYQIPNPGTTRVPTSPRNPRMMITSPTTTKG